MVLLITMTVLWLVFLEGLLSADNALVLAMMVRHLPKEEQKRALRYGIWGAFGFRVIAVGLAKILLQFWYLKVIGGVYLLYLAFRSDHEDESREKQYGLWGTVVKVEIADIVFSIDSILAAVAVAESLRPRLDDNARYAIVVTGGILGIITMRLVAGYFIMLLKKYPGLEAAAYRLVAWIGLKLVAGGLFDAELIPYEFNEWVFWIGMLLIVLHGLVFPPAAKVAPPTPPPPGVEGSAVVEEVA